NSRRALFRPLSAASRDKAPVLSAFPPRSRRLRGESGFPPFRNSPAKRPATIPLESYPMEREPTPSYAETVAEPAVLAAAVSSDISQLTSSSSADEGRFIPGALLGGRYRIIGLLGRGGMGEVYRATDLALGQAVALKFLPESTAADERALARFYNEVRVARQVTHPNVCRVYDVGQAEGLHYISMEFVDGEDLASLLRRIGRVPVDKALETARKLCACLAAAHEKGVLHRDLKPANIMIDGRGQVVI